MRHTRQNIKNFLLATMLVLTVVAQAVSPFVPSAQAAPPESKSFTNINGTAECVARLYLGEDYVIPQYLLETMSNNGASMSADVDDIYDKQSNGDPLFIMNFVPLDAGSDGRNARVCLAATMVSRPGNPRAFVGFDGESTLTTAVLNATTRQLSFTGTSQQSVVVINVVNDPAASGDPLSSSAFGSTGTGGGGGGGGSNGGVGYCADALGRADCMSVQVIDFNTMTYRDETYTLVDWDADDDDLTYALSETPYPVREFFLDQAERCKPQLIIFEGGDRGDNLGDEYDLSADNNDAGDYGNVLVELRDLPETGRIEYKDFNPDCSDLSHTAISARNFRNLRQMFQVFPKEKNIVLIANQPGSNNTRFNTGPFVQDANNPLRYNAPARSDNCSSSAAVPHIILDSEPSESDGAGPVTGTWTFTVDTGDCRTESAPILVKQTPATSTETSASVSASAGTSTAGTTDSRDDVCGSGGALGWILCPILTLLDESTQALEDQIQGFLFVDTDRFDKNTPGGGQIYAAWSTFRGLATVIIVIIALMMIFSQAMGEGLFDNYSLKKILPRLIIAGIGIQLSWFMLVELVNIFNILGNGIGGLVLSNFGLERSTNLRDILGGLTSGASGGDIATGALFVGLAIAAPLLMGGIFAIAIGVAASVLVGIITLIVRDMIILLGVITAPIAIAMSVLPGTQKTSKWWWESFEKALMMYPIIMLLLAAGKVVGNLLFKSAKLDNGELSMTYVIAGIIAWYIPYFFLPKALAAGGSALGKITGFAGDKTKGLFGKASSWNDKRVGAKKAWNTKIKDNQLAMQAGSGSKIAAARMRMRSGQPVTGRSFRKSKQDAINKGFLSLQDQAHEANTKDAERILQTDTGAAGVAYRNAGADSTALVSLIQKSTDAAERQAMISRLIALKDDKAMRTLMATPGNATPELIRAINKNEIGPAFGDKAPDIAKATSLDGRTFTVPPMVNKREVGPKTHSWSDETWKQVLVGSDAVTQAHYLDVLKTDPVAASHIDDKKLVAIEAAMGMAPGTLKPQLAKAATSDRRLKRSVNFIGYRHGVKLYSFQYLWSDVTYVGVMAQDLVDTHPEALSKDQFGYYMVNYSILGIEMKTLEEWTKQNSDVRA